MSTEEAQSLAAEWGCPFMEVSAKTKVNNEECFFEVVREIRKADSRVEDGAKRKTRRKPCIIL